MNFDNIKTENTYSLKDGPVFRFYNTHHNGKVNILNSKFRSFKAGSGEQFIQYLTRGKMQYINSMDQKRLITEKFNTNSESQNNGNPLSVLNIEHCTISNKGMMNYFVNYLFHLDLGSL